MNARCTIKFESGPVVKKDFIHYNSESSLRSDIEQWETSVIEHYPDWEYELEIEEDEG